MAVRYCDNEPIEDYERRERKEQDEIDKARDEGNY